MPDTALQQIFALTPSVLSRYLDFAEEILHSILRTMPDGHISLQISTTIENFRI
jgi:hypothetical protein